MDSKVIQTNELADLLQKTVSHVADYLGKATKTATPTKLPVIQMKKQAPKTYLTQSEIESIVETSLKIKAELSL